MLSQRWNYFLVWSANDEMRSSYAQPAMKFVPGMLSIFWMMFLKWVVIPLMLSMRENWLLLGWACLEIGYSLAEHLRKLDWLSIRGNWLLVGWAYAEIHFIGIEPCFYPVILSHLSVPCIPSSLPCLISLCLVSRPLFPSYVSVPCLPFIFPNLKSLFLLSHPPF